MNKGLAVKLITVLSAIILLANSHAEGACCSQSEQEKPKNPWTAARESSPIKPPEKFVSLEKIRSVPENPKKNLFRGLWRIGALSDGTIVALDNSSAEVIRLNIEGEELARWGGRGRDEDKFMGCQALEVSPENSIYVQDSMLRRVLIFGPDGKLLDSFKDIESMFEFRFSPSGKIYKPHFGRMGESDEGALVRVFDKLGTLEGEFGTADSVDFPELKKSRFFAPIIGNKEIVLLSCQFPIFQVYSTSGALQDEVLIDDPRFTDRSKVNRGKFSDQKGGRIHGALTFSGLQWLDNDLLICVVLDEPGVEFMRVNTLGEVVCSYFFEPSSPKEYYRIRDFVVIDNQKGLCFVGVSSKPWPQVVVFSPVEELPPPKQDESESP